MSVNEREREAERMQVKLHHLTADTAATSYDANEDLQPCGAPTKKRVGGATGKKTKKKNLTADTAAICQ